MEFRGEKFLINDDPPSQNVPSVPNQFFKFRDGAVNVRDGYRLLSATFLRSLSATLSGTKSFKQPLSEATSFTALELK
jgi:hypothetical protein